MTGLSSRSLLCVPLLPLLLCQERQLLASKLMPNHAADKKGTWEAGGTRPVPASTTTTTAAAAAAAAAALTLPHFNAYGFKKSHPPPSLKPSRR